MSRPGASRCIGGRPHLLLGARKIRHFCQQASEFEEQVDITKFMKFLPLRQTKEGFPLTVLLGQPVGQPDGWYRIPWINFSSEKLALETLGQYSLVEDGKADWQRAWHGTKIEALYSIMYHGKLAATHSLERGDRWLKNTCGVYVHKDDTGHKVLNCMRFVPLCKDGVFWGAKWELQVDRSDRVPAAKLRTDQWVQRERSVRLVALWVCGLTHSKMEYGSDAQAVWDRMLEARPLFQEFAEES